MTQASDESQSSSGLMTLIASIHPKVKAGSAGAAAAGLGVWMLSQYVFKTGVPQPVIAVVDVVVPGALALLAGYYRRAVPKGTATAKTTTKSRSPANGL